MKQRHGIIVDILELDSAGRGLFLLIFDVQAVGKELDDGSSCKIIIVWYFGNNGLNCSYGCYLLIRSAVIVEGRDSIIDFRRGPPRPHFDAQVVEAGFQRYQQAVEE